MPSSAYERFLVARQKDLSRIARSTRGEYVLDDVQQQAWLTAYDIQASRDSPICFDDPHDQRLVLSYLFQHFVRYTEKNVRHAVKLDHGSSADDFEDKPHFLLGRLSTGDHDNPLNVLMESEDLATIPTREPPLHQTQAGAYVQLLHYCGQQVPRVANLLLISISHCYKCFAKARRHAQHQHPLVMPWEENQHLVPRAWRRFRSLREPVQLTFDFINEPTLWKG
jgi:hypothetical protein